VNEPGIRQIAPNIHVIAIEVVQSLKRGEDSLEGIAGVVKIKRMFERGITFVWGKNLNITPGEADKFWLKRGGNILKAFCRSFNGYKDKSRIRCCTSGRRRWIKSAR